MPTQPRVLVTGAGGFIGHHLTNYLQGVRGRNSDNTRLREFLDWVPAISLEEGLDHFYHWIAGELEKSTAPLIAGVAR